MRFGLLLALGLFFVAACDTPNHRYLNGQLPAHQTFAHIQPISLDVGSVEIIDRSGAAVMPEDFVFSLPDHAILYLSKKFKTSGSLAADGRRLLVQIEEANVVKHYKASSNRVGHMFKMAGEDEYRLMLRLRFEHRTADGRVLFGKTLDAERQVFISEHSSLAKRETAQLEALEMLFKAIDPRVEQIVKQEMGI